MKPSLFLSSDLNIASAPPSDLVAPLAADLSLLEAALSALSPAADAEKGRAKAAATAAAIRVLNVMVNPPRVVRDCPTRARNAPRRRDLDVCQREARP